MKNKKIARKLYLSALGYGMSERDILKSLNSIPHEMVDDFIYTMKRIAEKSGREGFEV